MALKTFYSYFFPGIVLFISAAKFVLLTANLVVQDRITPYDQAIMLAISNFAEPVYTSFFIFITKFGAEFIFLFLVVLLALFLKNRQYRDFFLVSAVTAGGSALVIIIKEIIGRVRPVIENPVYKAQGYSFPSGHSTTAMCFYGVLVFLVFKYVKNFWLKIFLTLFLSAIILLVGFSRVYLGVHYPSDVAAGYYLGLAWISFCVIIYRLYQ